MGKTDLFTQFYPTGFTQWVKLTMPTLTSIMEGVWFGDQLAVFRPNFVQNCGFRFCIQNAKFLDFVRFSSKTNFLCPYTWHHRHCQQLTSHNCRVSGAGKMVSTPTTVQMVHSTKLQTSTDVEKIYHMSCNSWSYTRDSWRGN